MNNITSNNECKISLENYDVMEDCLFFKILGEVGNELQQKGLLEALGIKIYGKIRVLDPKIAEEIIESKTSILDCHIKTNCGKLIDIEMQKARPTDFIEKIMAYMGKMVTSTLLKGKNYLTMNEVISVIITDFNFLKSPLYHNLISLRTNNSQIDEEFTDIIKIHTIEMPKFREIKKYLNHEDIKLNKEYQYLIFLDSETSHEERKEIVKMGDEGLAASLQKIEEALQDADAFDAYMTIKIEEMHQENVMNAKKEEGKEERNIEIATNLKNKGIPLEIISETTGMPISKIKKL